MSRIKLTQNEPGHWALTGELAMDTVPKILAKTAQLFKSGEYTEIDLSGVTRMDSAGLALIVEWQREARRKQVAVTFRNIPKTLRDIAGICGLNSILAGFS